MQEMGRRITTRGAARRQAMLNAAVEVILEKGVTGVTLGDILARSGGSKATLYGAFGDKDGLLAEAVRARVRTVVDQLQVTLHGRENPVAALRDFSRAYAERIVQPDAIRFYHLLMSETDEMVPIVHEFLAEGPSRTRRHLADFLEEATCGGLLDVDDPWRAADLLLSMLQGQCAFTLFNHTLVGDSLEEYRREVRARAEAAVDLFVRACRPAPAAPPGHPARAV